MIKIIKKRPQVNFNDRVIGVKGDNETAYREFTIDRMQGEIDLADYVPIIEIQPVNKNEPAYYDVLAYEVQGDSIYMRWDIKSHNTKDDGSLEFQIYFGQTDDTSVKVFQTYTDYFAVAKGIEGKEIGETTPPDIFESAVVKATEQADASANSAKQAEAALSKITTPSASAISVDSTQPASVVVNEVDGKIKFEFEIPKGEPGAKGDTGEKGEKGDTGEPGETGEDGYSPVISVTPITNGYRVTTKDINGDKSFDVINGKDGNNGVNGNDGYSPTINVSDIDGGHKILITDKNGKQEFSVMDGKDGVDGMNGNDGEDGFSPTISVETIGESTRITIIDKNETHYADIPDGASAYDIATSLGFEGSEEEWLDSLKGEQGEGAYPYEIKELQYDYDVYLDTNEVYHMTIDKDCNFILPTPKAGKIEQILIMADIITTGLSVIWGTEYFFDRCVPDLIVGECNIIFESNGTEWFTGMMLKGENDEQGGYNYIPKRGVDYWTEEDKAEIINDVIKSLPVAEEVEF